MRAAKKSASSVNTAGLLQLKSWRSAAINVARERICGIKASLIRPEVWGMVSSENVLWLLPSTIIWQR